MKNKFAASLLIAISLAYFSSCLTASDRESAPFSRSDPMTQNESNPVYLILRQSHLAKSIPTDQSEFYVQGTMQNGQFVCKGSVVGNGKFATEGEPGWFEIERQQFFGDQTPKQPDSPYLKGFKTASGFVPSSRTIH